MTDLLRVLPNFPAGQFFKILQSLELHSVSTADVLTLPPAELAQRVKVPALDIRRFGAAVLDALQRDLSVLPSRNEPVAARRDGDGKSNQAGATPAAAAAAAAPSKPSVGKSLAEVSAEWSTISTLDDRLDEALGGGIPTRCITEITGESGTAKTQFLLALLLAVQLPPPRGLGRPAIYISTESPLSTPRLAQMLAHNPLLLRGCDAAVPSRPSLDGIVGTTTPDLESQDHILQFQVPVEVQRRNVGLIVLDSVAANYRAEFDRAGGGGDRGGGGVGGGSTPTTLGKGSSSGHGSNMATRSAELVKLGTHLRDLAREHNLAVVVANQVSDRLSTRTIPLPPPPPIPEAIPPATQESPLAARSKRTVAAAAAAAAAVSSPPPPSSLPYMPPPPPPGDPFNSGPLAPPPLHLDHQQRFFTGWGDDPLADEYSNNNLKTPSLGLVWSTQIACRIALFRRPVYYYCPPPTSGADQQHGGPPGTGEKGWRRWMKVVFSSYAPASGPGLDGAVEFEVNMGGLKAVEPTPKEDGEDSGS